MSKTRADTTKGTQLARFKAYPNYKDSGVEWLGEIPAHWGVQRADAFLHYDKVQMDPSECTAELVFHYSIPAIQETGNGVIQPPTEIDSAKLEIRADCVLVSKLNPRKGVVVIAHPHQIPTICSTEFVPFEATGCDLRWAFYLFLAESTRQRISATVRSATRSHQRAEISDITKIWHGVPTVAEQLSIAAFLDRETARLDALVAKREELIKLLQEKRTALITRAVTKGLDPSVPMKDSGVEWLGEIPAHWEVHPLKRAAERVQTGTTPPTSDAVYYQDGVVAWYGPGSFGNNLPLGAPAKLISQLAVADHVARVFDPGSVAIVTIGATIGKVGFMVRGGSCNQQITVITFNLERVRPKFGAYQLKSFEPILRGIAPNTTLPILDQEEIGSLPFLLPPLPEQRQIADSLDDTIQALDAVIEKLGAGMKKIKEFRTALISAAVTGKIDVREEAA